MTPGAIVYVDTSALGALLIEQPESDALVEWLDQTADVLVSSDLLETELRRIAVREGIDQGVVARILDGGGLAARDRAVYRARLCCPCHTCGLSMRCTSKRRCDSMPLRFSPTTTGSVRRPGPWGFR